MSKGGHEGRPYKMRLSGRADQPRAQLMVFFSS